MRRLPAPRDSLGRHAGAIDVPVWVVIETRREDIGFLVLELKAGTNAQKVLNEARSEIDAIPSFPELAEEPEVQELTYRIPAIRVGVVGKETDDPEAEWRGLPVSVCGEMAGDPVFAPLLLGLGVDVLSMSSAWLPQVKFLVRAMKMTDARTLAAEALRLSSPREIYACCDAFYRARMRLE